jgi:hypothetical protein
MAERSAIHRIKELDDERAQLPTDRPQCEGRWQGIKEGDGKIEISSENLPLPKCCAPAVAINDQKSGTGAGSRPQARADSQPPGNVWRLLFLAVLIRTVMATDESKPGSPRTVCKEFLGHLSGMPDSRGKGINIRGFGNNEGVNRSV